MCCEEVECGSINVTSGHKRCRTCQASPCRSPYASVCRPTTYVTVINTHVSTFSGMHLLLGSTLMVFLHMVHISHVGAAFKASLFFDIFTSSIQTTRPNIFTVYRHNSSKTRTKAHHGKRKVGAQQELLGVRRESHASCCT